MTFTAETIKALSGKLDPAHVKERSQSGRKLSYVEGWHAIAEANRIFGFDAWNRETVDIRLVQERERTVGQGTGWGVTYIARVRVTVGTVTREGIGSGHGIDRDLGLAHESAIKEAETDAMKRALMTFGNPFGLALYDKDQSNVGTNPPERSNAAKVMIATIDSLGTRDQVKDWIFANKVEADKLADGEAVIAHARQRYSDLPKEEVMEVAE